MGKALFENKKIEEENFLFDDKWGKFFMYSTIIKRYVSDSYGCDRKIEVWSEDSPDGQPFMLKIRVTLLKYDLMPQYNTPGSVALLKMPYQDVTSREFTYVMESFVGMSEGYRSLDKQAGATVYLLLCKSHNFRYITKEEFDNTAPELFDQEYWDKQEPGYPFKMNGDVLVSYLNNAEHVVVPAHVKKIAYAAFAHRKSLKSVVLPEGLRTVGKGWFVGCDALEEVVVPESVEEISYLAFEKCTGLKKINLPAKVRKIGYRAFYGCRALPSIVLPEGLRVIEPYTFFACTALKEIVFPASLEKIERYAFEYCPALEQVTVPVQVKDLVNAAIPTSVQRIYID